jgi:hypothetical protein
MVPPEQGEPREGERAHRGPVAAAAGLRRRSLGARVGRTGVELGEAGVGRARIDARVFHARIDAGVEGLAEGGLEGAQVERRAILPARLD